MKPLTSNKADLPDPKASGLSERRPTAEDIDIKGILLSRSLNGRDDHAAFDDVRASRSHYVVYLLAAVILVFGLWAWVFEIDEVSSGSGTVIPTSREQVIQSLEGGILTELHVSAGSVVEKGQVLARLDPTKTASNVEETAARYRAALASASRLQAEIAGEELVVFPDELQSYPELIAAEKSLFYSRREGLSSSLTGLNDALQLLKREIGITQSLLKSGAASTVELIRLQRQRAELELKVTELKTDYMVESQEQLASANAEVQSLRSVVLGRSDSLSRLTLRSPVRGIVNDIEVTTIGGVIPPNGRLMEIIPLDEQLLIEARISPRDIAFIHPQQSALVKITAYDYSIFGGLDGRVVTISPDSVRDEVNPEIFYYRVFIRTESDALVSDDGRRFPIVPGMIATVDINTGSKTIWDYLLKPLSKAKEALRER